MPSNRNRIHSGHVPGNAHEGGQGLRSRMDNMYPMGRRTLYLEAAQDDLELALQDLVYLGFHFCGT